MKKLLLATAATLALFAGGSAHAGTLLCNIGGLAGLQECTIGSNLSLSGSTLSASGTATTDASLLTSGTLGAARLPNPSASTLGGVESIAAVSHNFLTAISTSGVPAQAQPAFTDISGSVAAAQLPNPSSSTLGGVQSKAAASNQFLNAISTSGVPGAAQPACTNLSDAGTGCSTTVGTAASAATGTSGHTLPFLDGANDFSGATQTFGPVIGAVVTDGTTSRTLGATDCGKTVRFTSGSAITVTAPNSLVVGCHIGVVQDGAGQITFSAAAGATINSAHSYTKTFGQYAGVGLSVMTNSGGSSAVYDLFGDGA